MPRHGGRIKRVRGEFENQLRNDILNKKRNDGTPYSEKSVDTFVNNVFKISLHFLGKSEKMVDLKWLEDSDKIIHWMNTSLNGQGYNYSIQTKLSMYQSIIVAMNTLGYDETHLKPYWTARDDLRIQKDKTIASNTPFNTGTASNQTKVLQNISKQNIFDLIDTLNDASVKDGGLVNRKLLMTATMLQIHTEFPFRNDLADVKVITTTGYKALVKTGEDKLFNWLVTDLKSMNFKFVLNRFKTQRKYGMIVGEVEDPRTINQLRLWLSLGRSGQFLFSKDVDMPLSRNNISVMLSECTKKYIDYPISTTLLAKIFNEANGSYEELTKDQIAKIKKQAHLRGHSVATRITHYTNHSSSESLNNS